jgi:hypothetical protein
MIPKNRLSSGTASFYIVMLATAVRSRFGVGADGVGGERLVRNSAPAEPSGEWSRRLCSGPGIELAAWFTAREPVEEECR